MNEEVEPPLATLLRRNRKRGKKRATQTTRIEPEPIRIEPPEPAQFDEDSSNRHGPSGGGGVCVSMFDDSVENHFRVMHSISKLCGQDDDHHQIPETDLQHLSSSTFFLREWADFKYEPRDVRFACGPRVTLRQFSSATVPKHEALHGDASSPRLSQDFVMYVGGPVWGLDWCPKVHQSPDYHTKCEFVAIAAHPPGSSYHKLGEPLTGRGAIQIWCLLNVCGNDGVVPIVQKPKKIRNYTGKPIGRPRKKPKEEKLTEPKRARGRPRKEPVEEFVGKETTEEKSTNTKRPKGRPRKKPIEEFTDKETIEDKSTDTKRPKRRPRKKSIQDSVDKLDESNNCVEVLAIEYHPESSPNCMDCVPADSVQEAHEKKQLSDRQTKPKKPRGRPIKKPRKEPVDNLDGSINNNFEVLAIEYSKQSSELQSRDCVPSNSQGDALHHTQNQSKRPKRRRGNKPIEESVYSVDERSNYVEASAAQYLKESLVADGVDCVPASTPGDVIQDDCGKKRKRFRQPQPKMTREEAGDKTSQSTKSNDMENPMDNSNYTCPSLFNENDDERPSTSTPDHHVHQNSRQALETSNSVPNNGIAELGSTRCSVPKDVALPRIVFCLAHHGKVAWDVKWRPLDEHDSKCKHRMGYLAVLLGNGSLEVWEVPVPRAIEVIYSSSSREGTDPRFVKLAPVFRCSMLKCGDRKSIPLTVEWSASPPHNYLLAGCHDGTVALWKFCVGNGSQDTMPLLCFSADTNPIRALSWAPAERTSENANVIATAGHGGLKFWDLRDPFRPLWDIDYIPRFIYSIDWLSDPRCVLVSFDDGTMRLVSLTRAASDTPITGKPFAGGKQQGLHTLGCLPFAVWSVQVSRVTGMVAYCCADGTVLRFQLTAKAVDKEATRHRAPHFLCASFSEEDTVVTINTPVLNNPVQLKTSRKAEPNKVKRENDKMAKNATSDDQTLALCYGDDMDIEPESGEKAASLKNKKRNSVSGERRPEDDHALVCIDEEATNTREYEIGEGGSSLKSTNARKKENGTEFEVFPSKLVAMHRVRWNMNKGSERWLCYGGAAGIIRCQEIVD